MSDLIWTPYPEIDAPVLFDARGHRRLGSLFYETTQDTQRDPVFTLKDYAFRGLPSVYHLYMDSVDEYDAAHKIVGSMVHWRRLLNCKWFLHGNEKRGLSGLLAWREDMRERDNSKAKALLMEKIKEGDKDAAKFLFSKTHQKPKVTKASPKPEKDGDVIDLNERFKALGDN